MADEKKEKVGGDGAKLADSNMALYASPLAKKVRAAAADTEKAWDGAGKEEGIQIWRIEKFSVVAWPKERYGQFYSGDSYIVLETYKEDPKAAALDYNVFFWIGKDSTQDEYGTAAYKTVELDDKLGGEPVQSREVQDFESEDFDELFPDMECMEGGVKSAFRKVEPEKFKNKLYQMRGKGAKVKLCEVKCDVSSINSKDAFVLDGGFKLWAMLNEGATAWEKRAATKFVDKLENERACKSKNVVGLAKDEGSDEFWKILGGKPDKLPDKPEAAEEKKEDASVAVYTISDNSGGSVTMTQQECKVDDKGLLSRDVLKSDDVVMIDTGKMCYVWTGQKASSAERRMAMPVILEDKKFERRPFVKICEGKEKSKKAKGFNALFA